MVIAGLIRSSLIDYPGKVAVVVFTQGCNFSCGFCHNPDLVPISEEPNSKFQALNEKKLFEFLESRKGKLDGVVITGGEPTLQRGLVGFIKKVKKMGYLVKLDTNGSNSELLSNLITNKLIDYVAMDIKNSPDKYKKTCGHPFSEQIKKSIELIINSNVNYEFRTTVLPHYHETEDFKEIGKLLKGAKKYTIQGFRDENLLDKKLKGTKKFTRKELGEVQSILEKYIKIVEIRDNL